MTAAPEAPAAPAAAPIQSDPATPVEAAQVATAPVIHADDEGDRPMSEFSTPTPGVDENPEALIRKPATPAPKKEAPNADPETVPIGTEKPPVQAPEKAEEFNPEKASPKQLREAFARKHAEVAALKKELGEIKAKPATPVDDPEKKTFQEKLEAAEKRHAELLEDLRFVNFEKHPDFKANYQQPFEEAYNAGRSHVMRMNVTLPDGSTRKGTAEDFDAIASKAVQDYDAAATMAEEMFGPVKAATVLNKLGEASALFDRKEKARAEWKVKGNEREKARLAEQETFQKNVTVEVKSVWEQSVAEAAKKYQQWSAPVDGDEEGNALLERGYTLANEAFASFDVMSPKLDKAARAALVSKHAAVFNKAAWFDRLAHKFAAKSREVAALTAKLKEFESSVPRGGDGGRGGAAAEDDGEQSIAAAVRTGKI